MRRRRAWFAGPVTALTGLMREEAASAGFYRSPGWNKDYPRLQILTIADLLDGKGIDMPPLRQVSQTFKKAPRAKPEAEAETPDLFDVNGGA